MRVPMIIDCISDLHGFYPKLEGGDLLIVAGDLTARDSLEEHQLCGNWLRKQDYEKIVVIAGNHDGKLGALPLLENESVMGFTYLRDSGCEFEGLKIWGSPYTPAFCNWHFMEERGAAIRRHWDLIPPDTDILITHGPPRGTLDKNLEGRHVGCDDLQHVVSRIRPGLHVFGHIHEAYGSQICGHNPLRPTISVNAAHCNRDYLPINPPVRITWNEVEKTK